MLDIMGEEELRKLRAENKSLREAWDADRQRLEDTPRDLSSPTKLNDRDRKIWQAGFEAETKQANKTEIELLEKLAEKDAEIDKLKNCLSNKKCMHEDNFKSILDEKDAEIKRLRGSIKDLLEARKSEIERLEECDICNKKASVHLCRECYNKKPALMAEDVKVLARYLNGWADCDKHPESSENGKITKYYEGYQQAVRDIIQKIGWERFEGWCGYDSKRKVQNKPTRKV